ncbi:hypothetical protein MHUMG1_06563 [Metarhizium humberi]|uniref:Uncharacterized protein n=1 Tax=Metarhizium humberi TaxID=2596975 RepID=A0A9P8M7T6_9HYPO|nr:hypothetical protein MHUMG1_06563 [Metarhizium humberi]
MVVLASAAAFVGALTPAADEPAAEPKLPFIPGRPAPGASSFSALIGYRDVKTQNHDGGHNITNSRAYHNFCWPAPSSSPTCATPGPRSAGSSQSSGISRGASSTSRLPPPAQVYAKADFYSIAKGHLRFWPSSLLSLWRTAGPAVNKPFGVNVVPPDYFPEPFCYRPDRWFTPEKGETPTDL